MKTATLFLMMVCTLSRQTFATTTLPVGPYGFSHSEFDNAFKKGAGSTQSGSFIYIRSGSFGSAVFDTGASGCTGGCGGGGSITGTDENNDLSNYTIASDISGSIPLQSLVGFYLRLNNSEANGYLASVQMISPTQVAFSLSEGASVATDGTTIFSQSVSLDGMMIASGVYYPFEVSADSGQFRFDFANGAARASFTDSTVTRTIGQVGFLLRNASTQLDNFAITQVGQGDSLPGDYNANGSTDTADYVMWRNNIGSGTSLPNDDTPGVGPDDYTRWRTHFGRTAGSGSALNGAVPEPATTWLYLIGILVILSRRSTTVPITHSFVTRAEMGPFLTHVFWHTKSVPENVGAQLLT